MKYILFAVIVLFSSTGVAAQDNPCKNPLYIALGEKSSLELNKKQRARFEQLSYNCRPDSENKAKWNAHVGLKLDSLSTYQMGFELGELYAGGSGKDLGLGVLTGLGTVAVMIVSLDKPWGKASIVGGFLMPFGALIPKNAPKQSIIIPSDLPSIGVEFEVGYRDGFAKKKGHFKYGEFSKGAFVGIGVGSALVIGLIYYAISPWGNS